MTLTQTLTGTIEANGARLYYEERGHGPAVLFIAGASGDAGNFAAAAERLADDFTVVTYDRRGNSRSPRPTAWSRTDMGEQAEDAAALVRALGIGRVVCFGTSGGGDIAIELVLKDAELLRGAVIHEPALIAPIMTPEELERALGPLVGPAMAAGGPRAVMQAFLRHFAGDATFAGLDPALRERLLGNAETFVDVELQAFASYRPESAKLLASRVPLRIGIGTTSVPDAVGGAHWLSDVLGAEPMVIPGGHASYLENADRFATALRPVLREFAA